MPIVFDCGCGKRLQVPESLAGKAAKCPGCRSTIHVPEQLREQQPQEQPREQEDDGEHAIFGPPRGQPDFFVPPPEKIGSLVAAYTTLDKGRGSTSIGRQILWTLVISTVILIGLFIAGWMSGWISRATFQRFGQFEASVAGVTAFLVLLVVGLSTRVATRYEYFCGYIGTHGCAYYECKGSRSKITEKKAFEFEDAIQLRVQTTHVFRGLIHYLHTSYDFDWTDQNSRNVFSLGGIHTCYFMEPPLWECNYQFALAAERAWSEYLLEKVLGLLDEGGVYIFYLTKGGTLTFRRGSMRMRIGGTDQVFLPDHIVRISLVKGEIHLDEPGSNRHSFAFRDLSNARVFLALAERLFDVPIE